MEDMRIRELAMELTTDVIKICETVDGHTLMVEQLEQSVIDIGTAIHASKYAADSLQSYVKLQEALRSCFETEYRLEVFVKTELADREILINAYMKCSILRRYLNMAMEEKKNGKGANFAFKAGRFGNI